MKRIHQTLIKILLILFVGLLVAVIVYIAFLARDNFANPSEDSLIYGNENSKVDELASPTSNPTKIITPLSAPVNLPSGSNWWDYPFGIREIPFEEVGLNVVMNKGNKLSSEYIPSDLVTLSNDDFVTTASIQVQGMIIDNLKNLVTDAKDDGINLSIVSGYRSYATQVSTYQYWVNYNGGDTNAADRVSARAGHSEHQLGTVVDFSTPAVSNKLGPAFNNSSAATWLAENANAYGFYLSYPKGQEAVTGYSYEGWHYRYKGE